MCSLVNTSVVKNDINIMVMFMYYNERIQYVRETKNITQTDIAKHLGIKQQQYASNLMPITYFIEVCNYLNVSSDYLLGLNIKKENVKTKI